MSGLSSNTLLESLYLYRTSKGLRPTRNNKRGWWWGKQKEWAFFLLLTYNIFTYLEGMRRKSRRCIMMMRSPEWQVRRGGQECKGHSWSLYVAGSMMRGGEKKRWWIKMMLLLLKMMMRMMKRQGEIKQKKFVKYPLDERWLKDDDDDLANDHDSFHSSFSHAQNAALPNILLSSP